MDRGQIERRTFASWMHGLQSRLAIWFPERQIYVRSEGRVQFYTLGRSLQMTVAGLVSIFLIWAAFSTVMVVFKDRIVAAEGHRFQQAQEAFEAKTASLQMSYDELVAKAASAQAYADGQLLALGRQQSDLERQSIGFRSSQLRREAYAADPSGTKPARNDRAHAMLGKAFQWLGLGHSAPSQSFHHPSIDRLTSDIGALAIMEHQSDMLIMAMERRTLQEVTGEKAVIAKAGIDPDQFLRRVERTEGVGGPEISLDKVPLDGISDQKFSQAYFRSDANLAQFQDLRQAETRLPTAVPLHAAIERTSGFGPRLDPFSGRYAFHPGIDFAGPTGTPVLATATGRVTFAGADGTYGNMVEIDHGLGLKTRYAHLLKVTVTQGQNVPKGTVVGRLGSTGRSTGPHVHYEVWYDNKVRNPDGFLRIGALAGNKYCMVSVCPAQRR